MEGLDGYEVLHGHVRSKGQWVIHTKSNWITRLFGEFHADVLLEDMRVLRRPTNVSCVNSFG